MTQKNPEMHDQALAVMTLVLKDHKDGNKTRQIVSGNSSNTVGLSIAVSTFLEAIASSIEHPYEINSSEDLISRLEDVNKKWREMMSDTEEPRNEQQTDPPSELAVHPRKDATEQQTDPLVEPTVQPQKVKEGKSQTDQWREQASHPEINPRKSQTNPIPEQLVQPDKLLKKGEPQTDQVVEQAVHPEHHIIGEGEQLTETELTVHPGTEQQTDPVVEQTVQPQKMKVGKSLTD